MLLSSLASAGVLGVTLTAPGSLRVDGEMIPMIDAGPAWLELSGNELHVIEARTTSDRPIAKLEVATPDGYEITVEWRGFNFAVTGVRTARPETIARAHSSSNGTIILQFGTSPAGRGADALPAPLPIATAPVAVEFLPKDTEWANLWVDGEKVAEFRVGATRQVVTLGPGTHKVEVHDFMEDEVLQSGTLIVSGPGPMKVGVGGTGVEVYTDPTAWTPTPRP